MARQQRNDIDYFPHAAKHGKKMFYIRSNYGNDGYTVWFMLLEELGKANYHYLDLSDEIQMMYLSASMMVDEDRLIKIINSLVKLEVFDKELWSEKKVLFNEYFVENIKDAYKKRSNDCITREGLISILMSKSHPNAPLSIPNEHQTYVEGDGNPQSKLKKTKVKKTIFTERENFFEIFYFKNYVYPLKEVDEFVNYYEARNWTPKGMDKPIVDKVALARTWKQQVDRGQSVTTAIPISIMRKWTEFYNNCKDELLPEELEKLLRCQPYEENGDNLFIRYDSDLTSNSVNGYGAKISKCFSKSFPDLKWTWKGKSKL